MSTVGKKQIIEDLMTVNDQKWIWEKDWEEIKEYKYDPDEDEFRTPQGQNIRYEQQAVKYVPGSFLKPFLLQEAIIDPNQYINEIKVKVNSEKFKKILHTDQMIHACRGLTLLLWKNKIKFIYEKTIAIGSDEFIQRGFNKAGTDSDKFNTIYIFVNDNIKKCIVSDEYYSRMIEQLLLLIKHELIHRAQKLHISNEKEKRKIYDISQDADIKKYYGQKYEIMARAWQIIEELKLFGGMNSEEIKTYMKRKTNGSEMHLENKSLSYYIYNSNFETSSNTIKLLYKYMYLYLEDK